MLLLVGVKSCRISPFATFLVPQGAWNEPVFVMGRILIYVVSLGILYWYVNVFVMENKQLDMRVIPVYVCTNA